MTYSLTRRHLLAGAAMAGGAAMMPRLARANTVLRYGNSGVATSVSNTFNKKLSDTLAEKTSNALSFEIFAGSLGGEQKLLDSMSLGSLDVYNGAYTGTREFDIFYSPGFFKDGEHAMRVLKSEIGAKASESLATKYSGRLIGVGRLGTYNLMLTKPIKSFEELKGMKIRSAQIEGCIEGLKFFGAIPTPIPFNEIYLALQQGIVDGVLTALNPGVAGKFYEVAKYVVAADFGIALDKEVISASVWDGLPEDQKTTLQTSFDTLEVTDYYQVGLDQKAKDLETWKTANGPDSVIELDASGIAAQLEPLNKRLAEEVYGAGAWDIISKA